jgi:uncharacterized protein (UPF0332 family)
MSLHSDLLAEARTLIQLDSGRPSQARLRRVISTAYYALFHLLVHEAAGLFARDRSVRSSLARVYSHSEILRASMNFSMERVKSPKALDGVDVPPELRRVATAFVALQEARHQADYNATMTFTKNNALDFVEQSERAFSDWKGVRRHDCARLYLGSFLLSKAWELNRQ